MSTDSLDALIVVGVLVALWWLDGRVHVFRKCRCGRRYCNTCGKEG